MLVTIAIALAAVAAVLLVAIATRPDTFRVQRSVTIAAPAEVVFAEIEDLHRWSAWNPYEKSDPEMRKTFEGAASGVGSSFHYYGGTTGEGRMTLAAIEPHRRIAVSAQFIKPFAATNRIEFTLAPAPGGVSLTWAMDGRNTFVGKALSLFIDMDRMIGGSFEKGLADIKGIAESPARTAAARPALTAAS
ncbi:MAG TPA: SRPBCC family protein [Longimicrobiaceae bacterium]